jgi:hypothetical protein
MATDGAGSSRDIAELTALVRRVVTNRVPDRETAERLRVYWSERLDALAEVLAGSRD